MAKVTLKSKTSVVIKGVQIYKGETANIDDAVWNSLTDFQKSWFGLQVETPEPEPELPQEAPIDAEKPPKKATKPKAKPKAKPKKKRKTTRKSKK